MDLTNPLRAVSPGVDADVLLVLCRSHTALTGAAVHRLAARSYAQVRACLHRLVEHGLVDAARTGNAVAYRLNRDHVLAAPLVRMASAEGAVEEWVHSRIAAWDPPPDAVAVFGSWARGEARVASDIDLLVVRSERVAANAAWSLAVHEAVGALERLTGNPVQLLQLTSAQLQDAVQRQEPLIASLRADARVLLGPPLHELLAAAPARRP